MIMDSLHFWRQEMHVDGFRFDLAAILSRDESGQPQANAPTLRTIDTDPRIADIKLIAEAWDAGASIRWAAWLAPAGASGTASSGTTCAAFARG